MVRCSERCLSQAGVPVDNLRPCPDSPNCVSSLSGDPRHAIAPLQYEETAEKVGELLIEVVSRMKRSRIVISEKLYLHVEFTSALFRFVDDVEFLFDDGQKVIHVRSASRVGYSDFGTNRKRVEEIRTRFDALIKEKS